MRRAHHGKKAYATIQSLSPSASNAISFGLLNVLFVCTFEQLRQEIALYESRLCEEM